VVIRTRRGSAGSAILLAVLMAAPAAAQVHEHTPAASGVPQGVLLFCANVYYSLEAPADVAPCHETRSDVQGWVCK
jgi:hypothetical protein